MAASNTSDRLIPRVLASCTTSARADRFVGILRTVFIPPPHASADTHTVCAHLSEGKWANAGTEDASALRNWGNWGRSCDSRDADGTALRAARGKTRLRKARRHSAPRKRCGL